MELLHRVPFPDLWLEHANRKSLCLRYRVDLQSKIAFRSGVSCGQHLLALWTLYLWYLIATFFFPKKKTLKWTYFFALSVLANVVRKIAFLFWSTQLIELKSIKLLAYCKFVQHFMHKLCYNWQHFQFWFTEICAENITDFITKSLW